MSIYTTQLRYIVERKQQEAHSDPDDYSAAYEYLGLNEYPIFDETYRARLNRKIVEHFWFREIGYETAAQFAWYLRRTMNEVMPYFNQLYLSEGVITDPITNKKYGWNELYDMAQGGGTTTETSNRATGGKTVDEHVDDDIDYGRTENDTKTFGKTTGSTTTTAYGRTQGTVNGGRDSTMEGGTHERVIHSDTPMNQISNSGVEDLNYASDVTYTDRNGNALGYTDYGGTTNISTGGSDTTTGSVQDGGTEGLSKTAGGGDDRDIDTTRTESTTSSASGSSETVRDLDESGSREHNVIGYDGIAPADLLMKWRKSFLNIDLQVIASLETLFFGLWN